MINDFNEICRKQLIATMQQQNWSPNHDMNTFSHIMRVSTYELKLEIGCMFHLIEPYYWRVTNTNTETVISYGTCQEVDEALIEIERTTNTFKSQNKWKLSTALRWVSGSFGSGSRKATISRECFTLPYSSFLTDRRHIRFGWGRGFNNSKQRPAHLIDSKWESLAFEYISNISKELDCDLKQTLEVMSCEGFGAIPTKYPKWESEALKQFFLNEPETRAIIIDIAQDFIDRTDFKEWAEETHQALSAQLLH